VFSVGQSVVSPGHHTRHADHTGSLHSKGFESPDSVANQVGANLSLQ